MSKDIHILELAAYEPPVIKEAKREDWVEFGSTNDYYGFLIDCYTNSTTNNAIINNVSRLIYGKGLSATNASKKPSEYASMMSLFSKDCVRYLCTDLKMLGQCAMQVIYSKDRKKIAQVHHIPVQLLRAEKCNEDGKIEGYYYSDDWSDTKRYIPKRISAFGCSNDELELYFVKPYSVGLKYYALPDYVGATPYCTLEESISEYLINEVNNGFSSRAVINFNNGSPSEEQQQLIKSKVLNQLTGTTGEKVIISFNNNQDSKTTVDSMPVNDAPDLYNTLTETCLRKIMLGHQITSPLLFGIASQNGFSSNADELKNSYILFQNMVINPLRQMLIDSFNEILAFNDITLDLFFEELQPLTADGDLTKTDEAEQTMNALNSLSPLVANKVLENMTYNEIRALVGLKKGQVPEDINLHKDFSDSDGNEILKNLEGEEMSDVWELIEEREYDDENTDLDAWIEQTESKNKSTLQKFADVIKSFPSRQSYLDKSIYKVRYRYAQKYNSGNSRDFCVKMMQRTNSGVVYRLEDIDKASRQGINQEFGHKGQAYDLFKFKGGVYCGHYWSEQLYRLKKKKDGTYYEDKALSSSQEVPNIPQSYKPTPTGRGKAKIAPKDMPDNGHHPNYKAQDMAKALLITRDDVVRFTSVNGGVDTDKFIQYVSISQDIHIQQMTGTRLLEKIQADIIADTLTDPYLTLLTDYIKPCLIHFAMVEYYPHAAYTIANKGVYKHGAENSESVSKEEVDFLMEKQRQTAMHYKERFIDYVVNNSNLFPEYYNNQSPDMYPNQDTDVTGWVL